MKEEKTFHVTFVWDGVEIWEVRARNRKEALDRALLHLGTQVKSPSLLDGCAMVREKRTVKP